MSRLRTPSETKPPRNRPELQHPSSFRDPDSTLFVDSEQVLRAFVTEDALNEATRALAAPFASSAVDDAALLPTKPADPASVPHGFAGAITSRRLAYVTDPREWSFEMRKDAALLTLRLSRAALEDGFEMKDASAFNVLFDGCAPVFVDHGSFRAGYSGHWPGYSQFGDHFVNPLLVEAIAGVPPSPAGIGIDGLPLAIAGAVSRGTARYRPGTRSWVRRRRLAERLSKGRQEALGERLSRTELPPAVVDRMMLRAEKLVGSLSSSADSVWSGYEGDACPYDEDELAAKRHFIEEWCREVDSSRSALDVGCNVGTFSAILAGFFDRIVAIDSDSVAIDALYLRGRAMEWGSRVTPAVVDITQPTPAIGWRNEERASFLDRLGKVDLAVWLAVIHHLTLAGGIPLDHILRLVARVSRYSIIEHIAPEDPSVRTMTAGRRWASVADLNEFRNALGENGFRVARETALSGTRNLVLVSCPS